jgi:hypothetical protein
LLDRIGQRRESVRGVLGALGFLPCALEYRARLGENVRTFGFIGHGVLTNSPRS